MFNWNLSSPFTRFTPRASKSSAGSNGSASSSPQNKTIKLYVNMVSQPSRTVAWALKVKGVDYEFINVEFGGAFIKSDEFKVLNPNGFVPVIRDGDFTLFEANAILTYLAEKFEWTDLYPTDVQTRAKVNEFLHWHHTNTRLFTMQIVPPSMAKAMGRASPTDLVLLDSADALIAKEMTLLEAFLDHDYIAHTDAPTVADYAAYCEIDQLEFMGYDFSKFEKVSAWIAHMKQIPFHDKVCEPLDKCLTSVGIRPPPGQT